jgi:hypothetical protein
MTNLLSKQMKTLIEENRLVQHVIGLTTMIVLVMIVGGDDISNISAIIYGFLGYILFVLSTKLDIHWNVILLAILLGAYFYEKSLNNKTKNVLLDKILSEDEKSNVLTFLKNKKMIGFGSLLFIISIGVYLYNDKKHIQYGGGFSWAKFLLY